MKWPLCPAFSLNLLCLLLMLHALFDQTDLLANGQLWLFCNQGNASLHSSTFAKHAQPIFAAPQGLEGRLGGTALTKEIDAFMAETLWSTSIFSQIMGHYIWTKQCLQALRKEMQGKAEQLKHTNTVVKFRGSNQFTSRKSWCINVSLQWGCVFSVVSRSAQGFTCQASEASVYIIALSTWAVDVLLYCASARFSHFLVSLFNASFQTMPAFIGNSETLPFGLSFAHFCCSCF